MDLAKRRGERADLTAFLRLHSAGHNLAMKTMQVKVLDWL